MRLFLGPAADQGLRGVPSSVNAIAMTRNEFKERLAKDDAFLKDVMAKPKSFILGGPDDLAAVA